MEMHRSRKEAMVTIDLEVLAPSERDRIERWRTNELERAGYNLDLARQLAPRLDIDLHLAADLVASGCSPKLAARILL